MLKGVGRIAVCTVSSASTRDQPPRALRFHLTSVLSAQLAYLIAALDFPDQEMLRKIVAVGTFSIGEFVQTGVPDGKAGRHGRLSHEAPVLIGTPRNNMHLPTRDESGASTAPSRHD